MLLRPVLLAAGLLLALPAVADTRHDLDDPALDAVVDGAPLSRAFVDVMFRIAAKGDPSVSRAAIVQALIDDRLIAAYARKADPDDHLIEDNKVAFSPAMQVQQAVVSNLQAGFREPLEAALRREKGGALNGLILSEHQPTTAEWNAVLGRRQGLVAEYTLSETGRAAAGKVVLLRYRFGQAPAATVTLREVYDAQNVQGRMLVHDRNGAFVADQARLLLKHRYIMRWARSGEGLGEADFAVFRRAMEDRLVHTGWMAHLGIAADIHDDPQHLKDLQAAVTAGEISAYYEAHRDDFRRIEKVRARHLRVKEEATAKAIAERLAKGEAFDALVREFSIAADADKGGELGWIVHGSREHGWLDSLAFLQKPGLPSRPVRLPGREGEEPGWEILLVDEQVMGWQPLESESVRYLASQAIARQKAVAEYRAVLDRLRRDADIRLHPDLAPLARPKETN